VPEWLGRGHFVSVVTGVHFLVDSSRSLLGTEVTNDGPNSIVFSNIQSDQTSVFHSSSSPLFHTETAAQLSPRPSLLPPSASPFDVIVSFSPVVQSEIVVEEPAEK
jgi:hypothetical protein